MNRPNTAERTEVAADVASDLAPRYVIDIVGLTKVFQRQSLVSGGYSTLKSRLLSGFSLRRNPAASAVTRAVNDLTLRIRNGASVGIIGRNGSGKSTLLKLITGIYKPTAGTVSVKGRVSALIELGAGFHPDFTGRENLFLGGIVNGLTRREVEERFDEIVEFAELREVIDDPIRTYSSGMFMRLGFSLAVHTDPDVLIVDEVLAVGDAAFTAKCKERVTKLRHEGKTLLLVSHDLEAVERWCDEAVWMHEGVARDRGDPRRVIDHYRQFNEKGEEAELRDAAHAIGPEPAAAAVPATELSGRWGSREIEITGVAMTDHAGAERLLFHPEDSLSIEIAYRVHEPAPERVFGISISRTDGVIVHGTNTDIENIAVPGDVASGTVRYRINRLGLLEGHYHLDVAVHRVDGYPYDYIKGAITFAVRSPLKQIGIVVPEHGWEFA